MLKRILFMINTTKATKEHERKSQLRRATVSELETKPVAKISLNNNNLKRAEHSVPYIHYDLVLKRAQKYFKEIISTKSNF